MDAKKELTKEEVLVLTEVLKYGSLINVAKHLSMTKSRIYTISKNIKTKLNARNITNAVYLACKNNYLK